MIVESGGSVDVKATGKLTIQSDTEVEINAPTVDINGSTLVSVNGGLVTVDGGPNIELNSNSDGGAYTA